MYRDINDLCPRCGVPLKQAGAARGCEECRGVWLSVEEVRDMASSMQTPPTPIEIAGAPATDRTPLPCPECTEPMEAVNVFGIPLDVCAKRHGIWFDANELSSLLFRVAKPPSS
jgi:Zn-finger nucleic acid-binding protein